LEHFLLRLSDHLVWVLMLALNGPAAAQIYKCKDAQGRLEYTATPCDGGAGQVVRGTTPKVAPPSPADIQLGGLCLDLQAKVNAARRQIIERDKLVSDLSNAAPKALSAGEAKEYALLSYRDRLSIQEFERQGEVAACGRVALRVGSAGANAAELDRRCTKLRQSMQDWLAGPGRGNPKVAEVLEAMKQERQREGCPEH
jgi:hypothetical protein